MWSFGTQYKAWRKDLLVSKPVDAGSWHSMPTGGNPLLVTMELPFVSLVQQVPADATMLQNWVKPNLTWAEDHFQERVGGVPLNPAPSHKWWPWNHSQHHDENEVFSHTYPERFWPKRARFKETLPSGQGAEFMRGIRFAYGDLQDVVNQLKENKYTRQAVLPVFFPEDTGNTAGVRVPCSLFYHFMYRDGGLHCFYYMRSCDFVRHFKDDVYMAARLTQWVSYRAGLEPGKLHMTIGSLHAMEGDRFKMTEEIKNGIW